MNLSKMEEAKADLLKAIELNPINVKALRRLSSVYINEGSLMDAEVYLKKCVNLEPNDNILKNDLKECVDLLQKQKDIKDQKLLNNWEKCLDLSQTLVKKCKNSFELKEIYFESLIQTFNIEKAMNYFKNCFSHSEAQLDNVQYLLSLAYYTDGKYDKSNQILNNLLVKKSDENLTQRVINLQEKLEKIQKLKEKANDSYKKNDFKTAIDLYSQLLELDTNNKLFNGLILSNRALCYTKIKEYFYALHDINQSIKLNSKYWKSYQRRANINIALKYAQQAKDDLRKVLELDPTNKDALILLDKLQTEEKKSKRRDFYKILGLDKVSANSATIKEAYRKLAIKWHPDKNSENEEKRLYAEKMFQDINEAYSILSDPRKKQIYDNGGHPDDPNSDFHSVKEQEYTNGYYNGREYKYESSKEKKRERSRDNKY